MDMLKAAGLEIIPNPHRRKLTEAEIIGLLDGVDGLLAGLEPLNQRVLSSARSLKALARVGIGMDNVDQAAASALGIRVSNTPEGPTDAVAELTVTALLAILRELVPANAQVHAGQWKKTIGTGLAGTRVLLVGFGRIGQRVAELLLPFRADLAACDPALAAQSMSAGIRSMSLNEGLAWADVISLHVAGAGCILGPDQFQLMRQGAMLLNSARGGLVHEPALIDALKSGRIRGAWFDVFPEEPYKGDLAQFSQVLLTPHVGTYTRQCRSDMETAAVRNLLRDLALSRQSATEQLG